MAFFKAVKDMMVPSFSLLLLLNVGLVVAARPAFRLPFKKTDWRYQAFAGLMRQGFQDAITLARVVVLTGTDCDPAFLRYFQAQDFEFVQALFGKIANIEPPKNPNPADAAALLPTFDMESSLSPIWSDLMITFGDYPRMPEDLRSPRWPKCNGISPNGYLQYDHKAPRPDNWDFRGSCYMILCPPAEIFNFRLDLAGTENPPAWARDENGELKPGWGCSGLGDTDSGYQKVVGSTVLHEMFHCLSIFDGVANYDNFIYDGRYYGQNNQIHMIKDFPLDYRSYGPWRAANLNQRPPDANTGMSLSIQNADNYVWYALSKYWSWKCGRPFGPANADEDQFFNGRRGLVPAPDPPTGRGGNPPSAALMDKERRSDTVNVTFGNVTYDLNFLLDMELE